MTEQNTLSTPAGDISVEQLARQLAEKRQEIAAASADLERKKTEHDEMEQRLVTAFTDAGIRELRLDDLGLVKPYADTFPAWGTDDFDTRANALRAAGEGELVREYTKVEINHQTLAARLREIIADNTDELGNVALPPAFDGVLSYTHRFGVRIGGKKK